MWTMFLKLLALSFSLLFIGYIIPGIKVSSFLSAVIAAIIIVCINAFVKPALMFFALPINILTLGISILFINALLFLFAAYLAPGIEVDGFWSAFLGALLLSLLSIGISWI